MTLRKQYETALRQMAAMTMDGEEIDGEPHEMSIDDAFETAGACIELARNALTPVPAGPQQFYVTMTWDDWPEGGSYGTIIEATTHAEAERLCKQQMAETRADSALTDGMTPDDVLEAYGDEWHVVDCFPLDDFIEWHTDQGPAGDEKQPDIPDPDACPRKGNLIMTSDKNITMICGICGGTNVRRDADAMWNDELQTWEIAGLYDNATCDDCGKNTRIEEKPF